MLLFGSAFAAYATAVALVGTEINLVPIAIGRVVTGDFGADPQMADALSLGMIVIIGVVDGRLRAVAAPVEQVAAR